MAVVAALEAEGDTLETSNLDRLIPRGVEWGYCEMPHRTGFPVTTAESWDISPESAGLLEEALRRAREDVCAAPGPDPEGESTLGVGGSGLEDDGEARRRFEELGSVAGCDDDGSGRFADVDVLARTDGADAEATGEGRASEPPSFTSMPFA